MVITLKNADFSQSNIGNQLIQSVLDYYGCSNDKNNTAVSNLLRELKKTIFYDEMSLFLPCLSDSVDKAFYDCISGKQYEVSHEGESETDYILKVSDNELTAQSLRATNPKGIRFTESFSGVKCNNVTGFFVSLSGAGRGLCVPPFSSVETYPLFRKNQMYVNFTNNVSTGISITQGIACASYGSEKAMMVIDDNDSVFSVDFVYPNISEDIAIAFNNDGVITTMNKFSVFGIIKRAISEDELKSMRTILSNFYKQLVE